MNRKQLSLIRCQILPDLSNFCTENFLCAIFEIRLHEHFFNFHETFGIFLSSHEYPMHHSLHECTYVEDARESWLIALECFSPPPPSPIWSTHSLIDRHAYKQQQQRLFSLPSFCITKILRKWSQLWRKDALSTNSTSRAQRLINLEIPVLVRSLKSSNVELG